MLAFPAVAELHDPPQPAPDRPIRILSWNISLNAFEAAPDEFAAVRAWARADSGLTGLLDRVAPETDGHLERRLNGQFGRTTPEALH